MGEASFVFNSPISMLFRACHIEILSGHKPIKEWFEKTDTLTTRVLAHPQSLLAIRPHGPKPLGEMSFQTLLRTRSPFSFFQKNAFIFGAGCGPPIA